MRRRGERASRSPSRRGRSDCVSGSPKRQLNSSTRGPVVGDHQPGEEHADERRAALGELARAPGGGRGRGARRPRRVPKPGTGEKEPMPPVFGPASPSPMRLKSCAPGARARARRRRARRRRSPRLRAAPRSRSRRRRPPPRAAPRRAPVWSRQTKTPLPAASPSALITHGGRATGSVSAVGTPAARMTSFANGFEPSMRAAAALGPKTATPAWRSSSATPATSGASGPTTTRSASDRAGQREQALAVLGADGMAAAELGDAGVPGCRVQLVEPGAWLSFHASACSRPPDPTRSTFTRGL